MDLQQLQTIKSHGATPGFTYQPLSLFRNEIRVLSLIPPDDAQYPACSDHGELVHCSIETVSLDDKTQEYERQLASTPLGSQTAPPPRKTRPRPTAPYRRFRWGDYGALSYTWGDQSVKVPICINGEVAKVGRNLEAALRALSTAPDYVQGLKLWVDSLCINQEDLAERNSEVKRMGALFGGASIVTVWIGELRPEKHSGLQLIHEYILRSTDAGAAAAALDDMLSRNRDEARAKLAIDAVDVITEAPFWSRIWVVQELCLGPFNPEILLGTFRFPLLSLNNFLSRANTINSAVGSRERVWRVLKLCEVALLVQERRSLQGTPGGGGGEEEEDLARQQKRSDTEILSLLLMLSRIGESKDPRDKLYGLMGMVPASVTRHINPDYGKSVQRVFVEFAHALIAGFGHLNFVLTGLSGTDLEIPSWVPDLTDTWDPYLWGTDCRASGHHRKPRFRFERDGLGLVVAGFQVDVVDGTAPHLGWSDGKLAVWKPAVAPSSSSTATAPAPEGIKTAIVRTLHRDASWDCTTGTTVLDIPWLDSLDAAAASTTPRVRAMQSRGWGPVLRHANLVDLTLLYGRLDEQFRPWGRRFRSFFPAAADENEEAAVVTPECSDPEAFVRSLDKHVGIVYPLLTTAAGRFGTAIRPVQPGDAIFVILGCDGLVVLRPAAGERTGVYQVISQCYVEGLMKGGDDMDRGNVSLQDVMLI